MSDLRILRAEGSNFMRLRTFEVDFEGGMNKVTGENGAGKSCLLAIVNALRGKRHMPDVPLNTEAKKGELKVSLGQDQVEYIVKWKFTAKGSYLSIERADGVKLQMTPQAFLDGLVGSLIDPWEFFRLATGTPAEQRKAQDTLRSLMTMECDLQGFAAELGYAEDPTVTRINSENQGDPIQALKELEELIKSYRKDWNKEADRLQVLVTKLELEIPLERRAQERIDVSALIREQQAMAEVAKQHSMARIDAERAEENVMRATAQLERAQEELEGLRKKHGELPAFSEEDEAKLTARIDSVSEDNEFASKVEELDANRKALREARLNEDTYDEAVNATKDKRIEVLDTADTPVPGLIIEDGSFMLAGVPLAQASTAEQLTAGFEIAMALMDKANPNDETAKILVCRDGNVMLQEAQDTVAGLCEKYGVQLIMELAMGRDADGNAPTGVIFVEDGVATNT